MADLHYESFDDMDIATAVATGRFRSAGSGIQIVAGRNGNGAQGTAGSTLAQGTLSFPALSPATLAEGYHGWNANYSSLPTAALSVAWALFDINGVALLTITADSSSRWSLRRGDYTGTVIAGPTAAAVGSVGNNRYFEVGWLIADSGGTVEVRQSASGIVTTLLSFSGDTLVAGGVPQWSYTEHYLGSFAVIDDIYWSDGSGSMNNYFKGDTTILSSVVDGDGTSLQWTPSTGSSHYQMLDETAPNSDTDYVRSATNGHVDELAVEDFTSFYTVYGLLMSVVAKKESSSFANALQIGFRHNGINTYSASQSCVVGYSQVPHRTLWERDETGAVWTTTEINASQAAIRRAA